MESDRNPVNAAAILARLRGRAGDYRRAFGVRRLGIFGSFVRGEEGEASDVDILVEFEQPTYRAYIGLKQALEAEFRRPVDLVTPPALKPLLRHQILNEVIDAADAPAVA